MRNARFSRSIVCGSMLALALAGGALTGCKEESPTVKKLESAGENVKDAAKDAGEAAKSAVNEGAKAVEKATK